MWISEFYYFSLIFELMSGQIIDFAIGILGLVWYLIVSIPDICTLIYFEKQNFGKPAPITFLPVYTFSCVIFELTSHLAYTQHVFLDVDIAHVVHLQLCIYLHRSPSCKQ